MANKYIKTIGGIVSVLKKKAKLIFIRERVVSISRKNSSILMQS